MRIAVNGLCLARRMTGVGRATRETLRALLRVDTENEYLLFLPSDAPDDLGLAAPNLTAIPTDVSLAQFLRSRVFEELSLPRRLKGARIDVFYAPSFLLPAWAGAPREVICVHDLAWRVLPATKSLLFRSYMNLRLPAALRRAARIVCVSAATRDDLCAHYGDELAARACVVPNGVDLDRFRPGPRRDGDAFAAAVGNADPRKNLATLADALPAGARLVLAGPGTSAHARPPAVTAHDYLDDGALVQLYRDASFVVQPSLYEGFGLPVLEAMACGAPVACSDLPVFREVAGDAARYFDPRDPGAMRATLAEMFADAGARAELAAKGLARAAAFRWETTARRLADVLREAAA